MKIIIPIEASDRYNSSFQKEESLERFSKWFWKKWREKWFATERRRENIIGVMSGPLVWPFWKGPRQKVEKSRKIRSGEWQLFYYDRLGSPRSQVFDDKEKLVGPRSRRAWKIRGALLFSMTECYCPTVISWGGNISRTRRNMAVKRREKRINIYPRYRKIKFEKFDTILFSIENKYMLFFTFPDNNVIIIFDPWRFSAVIADVFLPNDVNAARLTRIRDITLDLHRISARAPSMQNACTLASVKLHGASITLPPLGEGTSAYNARRGRGTRDRHENPYFGISWMADPAQLA